MSEMNNILLIVAAGKSSRFGGYPKALAKIGKETNVQNTIRLALPHFDKIYLAVSKENMALFQKVSTHCEIIGIQTGNGEAHSLLKCLKQLRTVEPMATRLVACWGDAFFRNSTSFIQLVQASRAQALNVPVLVSCAEDKNPYAWFETDGKNIKKARFACVDGAVDRGLHDQSLFSFNVNLTIAYLEKYKQQLMVQDEYDPNGTEIKLLYSFEYLYNSDEFCPAQYTLIDANNVLSFNTREELENIREIVCRQLGD